MEKDNKDKKNKQKDNDHSVDDRVTTTITGGDLVLLDDYKFVLIYI